MARDLDLPRGGQRELVVDLDRMFELNGEDSRTLAAVGAFRVVPNHDLDGDQTFVPQAREGVVVDDVDLGDDEHGLTLPREGRELLDAHALEREDGESQTFNAGVGRERELEHDSQLYAT